MLSRVRGCFVLDGNVSFALHYVRTTRDTQHIRGRPASLADNLQVAGHLLTLVLGNEVVAVSYVSRLPEFP